MSIDNRVERAVNPIFKNAYKETNKMRPQFNRAVKVIERYLKGKITDRKKAQEAARISGKFIQTKERENKALSRELRKIKKEIAKAKRGRR